jgi:hypothetical protein
MRKTRIIENNILGIISFGNIKKKCFKPFLITRGYVYG